MLRLAVVELGLPRPSATLARASASAATSPRDQAFRDLLDHPAMLEPMLEMCGPKVRLDHTYGITMAPGSGGLGLHGGGDPHDPAQFYEVRGGRMYNGLVAVQWALVDHRRGDGGFGCIPGSHKAVVRAAPAARSGAGRRGADERRRRASIFTEALTHCTIPWRGPDRPADPAVQVLPRPLAVEPRRQRRRAPGSPPDRAPAPPVPAPGGARAPAGPRLNRRQEAGRSGDDDVGGPLVVPVHVRHQRAAEVAQDDVVVAGVAEVPCVPGDLPPGDRDSASSNHCWAMSG